MPGKVLPLVFLALAAACCMAGAREDAGFVWCGDLLGEIYLRGCGNCTAVDIPLNPSNVVMESVNKPTITPGTRMRVRRARNSKVRARDFQGPIDVSTNVTLPTCNSCKPGYFLIGEEYGQVESMPTTPQPVIDFSPSFCGECETLEVFRAADCA